jgi:hypothetical protein
MNEGTLGILTLLVHYRQRKNQSKYATSLFPEQVWNRITELSLAI